MEIARHWRLRDQYYNMIGTKCSNCGRTSFPPRAVCPDCAANAREQRLKETTASPKTAEITAIAVMSSASSADEQPKAA